MTTTFIDTKKDLLMTHTEDGITENWFYSARTAHFISLPIVEGILENCFYKNNFQQLQINFTRGKQGYSFVGDDWDCLNEIEKRMISVKAINYFVENEIKIITILI